MISFIKWKFIWYREKSNGFGIVDFFYQWENDIPPDQFMSYHLFFA